MRSSVWLSKASQEEWIEDDKTPCVIHCLNIHRKLKNREGKVNAVVWMSALRSRWTNEDGESAFSCILVGQENLYQRLSRKCDCHKSWWVVRVNTKTFLIRHQNCFLLRDLIANGISVPLNSKLTWLKRVMVSWRKSWIFVLIILLASKLRIKSRS